MPFTSEYHKQLSKLRSSILFTIDKTPKEKKQYIPYLETVLENVLIMMEKS